MIPNLPDYARLIKERVGLHFDNAMEDLLKSALSRRMGERKIADYYEYYEQLRISQVEFDSFITLITINETYFFRESDTLDLICDKWVPRLLQQRSGPVRILSAGCSSGEEAYSLAIKLHEQYRDAMAQQIEIYGCDIDPVIWRRPETPAIQAIRFAASRRVFSSATLPVRATSTGCMMRFVRKSRFTAAISSKSNCCQAWTSFCCATCPSISTRQRAVNYTLIC